MIRNRTETIKTVITKGVSQPRETPSDNAIKRSSNPAVKKKAPIQSTFEALGWSALSFFLGGSLGITNMAAIPLRAAAPAMTKKTTFQFAHSEIMPP
jgi:hypothetical protein